MLRVCRGHRQLVNCQFQLATQIDVLMAKSPSQGQGAASDTHPVEGNEFLNLSRWKGTAPACCLASSAGSDPWCDIIITGDFVPQLSLSAGGNPWGELTASCTPSPQGVTAAEANGIVQLV